MSEEKVIVKLFKNKKLVGQSRTDNYDVACKYAFKKIQEGYSCLLLRQIDDKEWFKIWFNPSDVL